MPNTFSGEGDDPSKNQNSDEPQGDSFNKSSDNDKGQGGDNKGNQNSVDVDTLQKRVNDSQEFIETLKSERAQDREELEKLRSELANRPTLDDIREHINQRAGTNDNLDPEDLINKAVTAVETNLTAKEQAKKEQANIQTVSKRLQDEFGADVDTKVAELAAENDMTFDEVFDLAKRNPTATYKLLGITTKSKTSSNGTEGSLNTLGVQNQSQNQNKPRQGNIMTARSDRDRVQYMQNKFKEMGI